MYNIDSMFANYAPGKSFTSDVVVIESRLVKRDLSRAVVPTPAGCKTELSVVNLRPSNDTDPSVIYNPSCTRIQRCSGCCSHDLLACQPIEVEEKRFRV